ncbi:MAG: TonB-dependent receptor, partial [Prevotellaceae bacterium]|nr:TonB-dependent receptor [Prevotellaceae bacterium]
QAQTIEGLRITKDYRGRLDDILNRIGKDKNIRFIYDTSHVSRYTTSVNMEEEKSIGGMLKMFRRAWDMETWISNDGYIYVARSREHLEQLKNKKTDETVETQIIKRSSKGNVQPGKKNFTLTGNIFDAANGERIPYAWVSVFGTTKGVTADANGYFILEQTPSDTATLVVQYIGYLTQYIELEPSGDNPPLHIELEVQPMTIAEVFITGRKDDKALQQSTGEHKMKMSPIALKVLPNLGEKDIMRGFQLMPGVSASNENSSGMYVRGGTPDQNLIVYDGFTVYYVDHLHGFYSAFNANAVKDVQLYKGGFEAKYGGRLSSVTEITAKDGNAKKISAASEINLLSLNLSAEIPIGERFTSLFAFRRSYQGYLYGKIGGQNDNGNTSASSVTSRPAMRGMQMEMPDSYFYDLNAKLTWRPTDNDVFSFSFFNGTDYVDNTPQFRLPSGSGGFGGGSMPSFSMENANYENYGNTGTSLRWAHTWNEKLTSSALLSFSNFYSTRDQTRSISIVRDDETTQIKTGSLEENNLIDASLKSDWKYSLNDRHVIEAGGFATYYNIDYSYAQSDTAKILEKGNRAFLAGMYAQDKIRLWENNLTLIPGARLTYYGPTGKPYVEPRLSASYLFNPRFTLNAATGIFYQFANRVVREDVLSGNADFWILSDNKEIPVSQSIHFNAGINYDLPDYLFSIEGYYKLNDNISEYTLRFERPRTMSPGETAVQLTEHFYTGHGYAIGIELLAQKKAGNFSGWISYTLGQVKNRFPEQSDKYFYASQDVTHELKTVGIYKFGNFDFSATLIYSTGRPYTAPLGAYQINPLGGAATSYYAVSDKNNFRLPDYIRLDMAATYRFDLLGTKGKAHAIGLSVFNVLNRKNVSAKQFQIVDNAILESNINYLSITPNLSLIFKF